VQLSQYGSSEADDRSAVWKGADDVGAARDFLPVALRERGEREHVFARTFPPVPLSARSPLDGEGSSVQTPGVNKDPLLPDAALETGPITGVNISFHQRGGGVAPQTHHGMTRNQGSPWTTGRKRKRSLSRSNSRSRR
jgi:hypothetical protein